MESTFLSEGKSEGLLCSNRIFKTSQDTCFVQKESSISASLYQLLLPKGTLERTSPKTAETTFVNQTAIAPTFLQANQASQRAFLSAVFGFTHHSLPQYHAMTSYLN